MDSPTAQQRQLPRATSVSYRPLPFPNHFPANASLMSGETRRILVPRSGRSPPAAVGRDESVADENGGSVRQRLRPANSGRSSLRSACTLAVTSPQRSLLGL